MLGAELYDKRLTGAIPKPGKDTIVSIYQVGETNLEFTEPLDANSAMGQYLAREGPGVYHIAFGVDGIAEVAKGLAAQGHTLREPGGTGRSAEGYLTATLDPASALGFPFQVAEG
jgi:methylmalonyl-CoA/ethylmalonyl-CoA epimerase